jgi:hypothetical protein
MADGLQDAKDGARLSHNREPCRGELSVITAKPSWRALPLDSAAIVMWNVTNKTQRG